MQQASSKGRLDDCTQTAGIRQVERSRSEQQQRSGRADSSPPTQAQGEETIKLLTAIVESATPAVRIDPPGPSSDIRADRTVPSVEFLSHDFIVAPGILILACSLPSASFSAQIISCCLAWFCKVQRKHKIRLTRSCRAGGFVTRICCLTSETGLNTANRISHEKQE